MWQGAQCQSCDRSPHALYQQRRPYLGGSHFLCNRPLDPQWKHLLVCVDAVLSFIFHSCSFFSVIYELSLITLSALGLCQTLVMRRVPVTNELLLLSGRQTCRQVSDVMVQVDGCDIAGRRG